MKSIRTKYLGPTDRRGSRIMATDDDGNRITVPYNHSYSGEAVHRQAAIALCAKLDWHGTLTAGGCKGGYIYVWHDDDATLDV